MSLALETHKKGEPDYKTVKKPPYTTLAEQLLD